MAFTRVATRDGSTTVKGGWQGGRGWQVDHDAMHNATGPGYLHNQGKWMIENVKEALDSPNEWWFDRVARKLYVFPNATSASSSGARGDAAAPPSNDLVAVVLDTLVSINATMAKPAKGITLQGVGLRDAADVTMKPWGVPSGGDWGLYRGGAVFIEGCEGCAVKHSLFERIDGNGILVSGYTRDVVLSDNEFAWIGNSAMAAWGYTKENDGTGGQQPRFTTVARNYVREIGLIEKQSSMWFQAKTCESSIEDNVVFNGPRAAINFNDGFGGGTNTTRNLIFNQCRESGDHGPINSWDRNAFISDVYDGTPSYTAKTNSVAKNFIIANYGASRPWKQASLGATRAPLVCPPVPSVRAHTRTRTLTRTHARDLYPGASQGFDTDDGSSWYDIHDNFFFMADGWKMDYGGHDSKFTDNIVYHGHNDGQDCVNSWPFLTGHGVEWRGNKCILPKSTNLAGTLAGCKCPGTENRGPSWAPGDESPAAECGITFSANEYYTMNGTAYLNCDDKPDWGEWTGTLGNDKGSTLSALPSDDDLMKWARAKLDMPAADEPLSS